MKPTDLIREEGHQLTRIGSDHAISTDSRAIRLWRAGSLVLPLAAFALVLTASIPASILDTSFYSLDRIVLLFGPVLLASYQCRRWFGVLAILTLTLCLFSLPLVALWRQHAFHPNAVGGLLPWSDASGYYYDARRLIDGHLFGWSARRPLFAGMLAGVLVLTGGNLQITLVVFVAVNAIATVLLARTIYMSQGATAAVIVTMLLFAFYRDQGGLGTTLTENLGLPLGALALAIIWTALEERQMWTFLVGSGLLTLGLMARAGAFFVLPAMMLVGGWAFNSTDGRPFFRMFVITAGAMGIAVVLNSVLGHILADPLSGQSAFSNFSYSLYGLVVGGKGWGQVMLDHPGAREGAEIYALALQAFRAHPMGLVVGSLKMWREYFPPNANHAFAFARDGVHSGFLQSSCYVLTVFGAVQCIRNYRKPQYAALLAVTAGHLASVPFVPPIDAGLRVYAATVPILAVLVAVGCAECLRMARQAASRVISREKGTRVAPFRPHDRAWSAAPVVCGLVLACFTIVAPLLAHSASRSLRIIEAACPPGQSPVHVRITPGSFLRIRKAIWHQGLEVQVPDIRAIDLQKTASLVEIKNDVNNFTASKTLVNAYDLKSGRIVWLVAPTDALPPPPTVVRICGHNSDNDISRSYGVFYADSVQRLPQLR